MQNLANARTCRYLGMGHPSSQCLSSLAGPWLELWAEIGLQRWCCTELAWRSTSWWRLGWRPWTGSRKCGRPTSGWGRRRPTSIARPRASAMKGNSRVMPGSVARAGKPSRWVANSFKAQGSGKDWTMLKTACCKAVPQSTGHLNGPDCVESCKSCK